MGTTRYSEYPIGYFIPKVGIGRGVRPPFCEAAPEHGVIVDSVGVYSL